MESEEKREEESWDAPPPVPAQPEPITAAELADFAEFVEDEPAAEKAGKKKGKRVPAGINKWTTEEDEQLMSLVADAPPTTGEAWEALVPLFKGRSAASLRWRWVNVLSKPPGEVVSKPAAVSTSMTTLGLRSSQSVSQPRQPIASTSSSTSQPSSATPFEPPSFARSTSFQNSNYPFLPPPPQLPRQPSFQKRTYISGSKVSLRGDGESAYKKAKPLPKKLSAKIVAPTLGSAGGGVGTGRGRKKQNQPWTTEDESLLTELVVGCVGRLDWDKIAEDYGNRRSAASLQRYWYQYLRPAHLAKKEAEEAGGGGDDVESRNEAESSAGEEEPEPLEPIEPEDPDPTPRERSIEAYVSDLEPTAPLPSPTPIPLTPTAIDPSTSTSSAMEICWNQDDTTKLVELLQGREVVEGSNGWGEIAKLFEGKTEEACQKRWEEVQSNQMDLGGNGTFERKNYQTISGEGWGWSREDENLLLELMNNGTKPKDIAERFPTRTYSSVSHRMHLLRKRPPKGTRPPLPSPLLAPPSSRQPSSSFPFGAPPPKRPVRPAKRSFVYGSDPNWISMTVDDPLLIQKGVKGFSGILGGVW